MILDRVIVTVIVYDLIVAKIKPVLTYGTGPNDYFSNRLTTTICLLGHVTVNEVKLYQITAQFPLVVILNLIPYKFLIKEMHMQMMYANNVFLE